MPRPNNHSNFNQIHDDSDDFDPNEEYERVRNADSPRG